MSAPTEITPELLAGFLDEAPEYLEMLDAGLMEFESQAGTGELSLDSEEDHECMNTMFRAAHSLKGLAAAFGFERIKELTHRMETLFDHVRMGTRSLNGQSFEVLYRVVDRLKALIAAMSETRNAPVEIEDVLADLDTEPEIYPEAPVTSETTDFAGSEGAADGTSDGPVLGMSDMSCALDAPDLRINVSFAPDADDAVIQAHVINNKLSDLGTVVQTIPDLDALCVDDELREVVYVVQTDVARDEIQRLLGTYSVASVTVTGGTESVEWNEDAGATPTARERLAAESATAALLAEVETAAREKREPPVKPRDARTPSPKRAETTTPRSGETLRVDQERLDRLMNLGGELVINRARFTQIGARFRSLFNGKSIAYLVDDIDERLKSVSRHMEDITAKTGEDDSESAQTHLRHIAQNLASIRGLVERVHELRASMMDFDEALHGLTRVSDGIQKGIMGTRMAPIGPLFSRFRRVVRDIAKSTGKHVELILRGEHTQLDKRMIDELGDPLTHMVRNSVDHGIELPGVRAAQGKPEVGTVILEACHRGNSICVEVIDDGAGINLERVRAKVIERELATPQQVEAMTDRELIQYVFKPGFSTAAAVTDLSGRGMGMDIVVNKIEKLSGSIEIDSVEGEGAHVTIMLPLTLAILTSMVARIGESVYAIPLESVAEIITVNKSNVHYVQKRAVVQVRDRIVPLAYFEDIFETAHPAMQTETRRRDKLTLVIVGFDQQWICLAVDELFGLEDVVIKSIAENYRNVKGFAGASIRGDGTVSLILDIGAMLDRSQRGVGEPARNKAPAIAAVGA